MVRQLLGLQVAIAFVTALATPARGEVTAAQVNAAIANGMAFLEKQQQPGGNWPELAAEPGGVTALCTLALLNCGRTPNDPSVKKALDYLERHEEPARTYSTSLFIMAFTQADPKKYALKIQRMSRTLAQLQVRDNETKGGWSYERPTNRADNSNTQFAMLALHEAEKAGAKLSDQTWQLALNYWTKPGMQYPSGAYGYLQTERPTGSMTCAGIASLIIARDRLAATDAKVVGSKVQCCGAQAENDEVERALAWMGQHFSVERNPDDGVLRGSNNNWWLYYLYALERVGRMSGQRFFVSTRRGEKGDVILEPHDWYREGCEVLIETQDKFTHRWTGQGSVENDPTIATSLALLFLSKGRRPVVIGKLQHQPQGGGAARDWDHHRRAVQHLTMRVERQWQRDLSWQTIDFTRRGAREGGVRREQLSVTAEDLFEAPVLFLSGSLALDFSPDQKSVLKTYIENGGFLFAEACDGNGCDGTAFDRSFRALMRDMFPDSELRKLPPDHPVWFAQEKVDPKHLPKDSEFWLWGLDACCRTSVVYCPRSLSCYWELAHPYRESSYPAPIKAEIEAVTRVGGNVLAYATSRELKEKLDRPQLAFSNPGGKSPRGALVVPKLSHSGGADDAPAALSNLLTVMEKQLQMRVDYDKRLLAPTDEKLLDHPLVFMHGRRAFHFSSAERKALKEYLSRGGFLFADAICANKEFAEALRHELKAIFPDANFVRIPPSHPLFTEEFNGFSLQTVTLRDPQLRDGDDPLTAKLAKVTPLLEGLEIDGRLAVILSPYDISCALEKGTSLDCKGYIPADAARLAANVLLYALQQ
jgi:hypothetical protein